jgi:methyl-accepting chemotaxis protein
MSQTTQQNASSSEELAATAEEMSSQAEQLQQAMAFFRLAGGDAAPAARKPRGRVPAAAPKRPGIAVHNPAFALDADLDESNFTRF